MARARRLEIILAGDSSGATRALGTVESRMGRTSSAFSRFGKTAALGIGAIGVAAGAMVLSVGRDLANMQRLQAQTGAAIRSTGGAARVSVRDVTKLADTVQGFSGIQAESVIEGQNMLLTFTNIRNEVGRNGTKTFDQAALAAVDFATAMGTDIASASMQVGKALNNPIAGLTRLQRVGVEFTDQQKAQVEQMMAVGDTAGAQGVILMELNRQFGGSAQAFGETTAGQFARAKESIMDVVEGLVVGLMPAFTSMVEWVRTTAVPAIQNFADWIGPKLTQGFAVVSDWVRDNWPQIQRTITDVMTNVRSVVGGVVGFIQTAWAAFGDDILGHIQRVWPAVQQVIGGVMRTIQGIVQTVTAIISGDWGAAWDGMKKIVTGTWNAMIGIIRGALSTVRLVIGAAWQVVTNITSGAWRGIKRVLNNIWDGITDGVRGLKDSIGNIWERVKSVVAAPVNWLIRNVVNPFLGFIRRIADFVGLGGAIPGPFGTIGAGASGATGTDGRGDTPGMGDGPGFPVGLNRAAPRSVLAEATNGTGDGPGMFQDILDGLKGLTGKLGGPPPFKGVMGGLMDAPLQWAIDQVKEQLRKARDVIGGIGGSNTWELLWRAVSSNFPDAQLFSAVRPGAITATGNASYHGMGRAIDISPRMDIFDWIVSNYGAQSKEVIFSPAGNRQIHNGSPHWYGEPTRGDHWDHIHWAMAKGTPGWVKVKQPTAFVAGEAGTEYMNISRGRPSGGGVTFAPTINFNGPVSNEAQVMAWVDKALKQGVQSPELRKLIRSGG